MKKLKNMAIGAVIAVGMFFGAYFGKDKLEEEPDEEEEPSSEVLRMPSTAFTSVPTESIEEDFKTSQERVQEVTDAILKEKERVAKEKAEKEDAERHEKALAKAEERRQAKEKEARERATIEKKEAEEKAEKLRKEKEVAERKKAEESKKNKEVVREKNEVAAKPTQEKPKEVPSRGSSNDAVWQSFESTAYGMDCKGCSGITANGTDVRGSIYTPSGLRVIAVDPRVIPLGSIVEVNTPSGTFTAEAADTGGAIKGRIIDILVGSEAESRSYGRQQVKIRVLK